MKTKAIKNIKVGDYVQSYNHKKDRLVSAKVTEIFKHKDVPGSKIIINKKFIATGNHPVYLNGKYKPAARARVGDVVIDSEGIEIKIDTLEITPMKIDVYNIEVEGDHNYFAGNILNHNKCGEYKGKDKPIGDALGNIEAQAEIYTSSLQQYMTGYYDTIGGLVGSGTTGESDFVWDEAIPGVDATFDQGTELTPEIPGVAAVGFDIPTMGGTQWAESGLTGLTSWGGAVADYRTAAAGYQTALTKAATATISAEDTLDIAGTDVEAGLETQGGAIAGEVEEALEDVRAQTGAQGFAATGTETMMKEEVRSGAGEKWEEATSTATSSLASALSDYEKLMGGGGDVDIEGEMTTAAGTIAADVEAAGTALSGAQTTLEAQAGDIDLALKGAKSTMVSAITSAGTTFASAAAPSYAIKNVSTYMDSPSDIVKNIEAGISTSLGVTDFSSATYQDFGFSMGSDYTETDIDRKDVNSVWQPYKDGKWQGDKPGNLEILWGGACLEGNVRVVMGDKNGSN